MNVGKGEIEFDKMLELAKFAADRHNERRQVVFRIFISYMTLLVIAFSLVMRHWKDDFLSNPTVIVPIIVFLSIMFVIYSGWLITIYKALCNDVRRRDFHLVKAEILCYYMSNGLHFGFKHNKNVTLNLASSKSYAISERCLFKKSEPDLDIDPLKKKPSDIKIKVFADKHFLFNFVSPLSLTLLITLFLIGNMMSKWFN